MSRQWSKHLVSRNYRNDWRHFWCASLAPQANLLLASVPRSLAKILSSKPKVDRNYRLRSNRKADDVSKWQASSCLFYQ